MGEHFLHLLTTIRYGIVNNGYNSGYLWHESEVLEFKIATKMQKVASIGALVHDFISVSGQQLRNPR